MTVDRSNQKLKAANQVGSGAWVKWGLIGFVVVYLGLILFIPALNVFVQACSGGIAGFLHTFNEREFQNAVKLTLIIAAIVVPVNTIFGLCAAWVIARNRFPGRTLLLSILDLPFSISPVVAGLMIVLLYGRQGWFGPMLQAIDLKVIFALPGMILATSFVSLPFVAREVIPVLEEVGPEQEEAAKTLGAKDWQIFWRVTLPNVRWGLIYGIILTNARAMGEFGAVSVVSGNILGKTQTMPLFVEEAYKQYNTQSAYTAATLLACLAIVTLIVKEIVERRTGIKKGAG
ncbi:sulfate ABC transporter permease subunit CysW [Leptolyngbya sp. FACHB-711]|uniref:sulfate ABC transporter permease subunit CysW n=1 Tax=unclassified Leptolyngbya TaxID=2650499 RepID=UPI0016857456|nr:sulfate ABC transporter permease subunit CysW [Cyanobacteria bacterium FACHB-502]MBD2024850.1 sulfate ABC transporter permease subunit CysW [Leptolyngbya sp. FACHB-711]